MRVLYIAFYFPPTTGGGVERTLRFCEHLPALGIDVEVLVPDDARWLAADPASLARIPAGLAVHRCRYRGPAIRERPGDRLDRVRGVHRLLLRVALAPRRLLLPDANVVWLIDLLPAAARLLRSGRFDAIVTTAPPHAVSVAGAILARRSGLPWVADWRDAWLENPDLALERRAVRWKRRANGVIARWSAHRMTSAACVNDAIAAEVGRLAPLVPTSVVPNGAEVERIVTIVRHPSARLTLTYTGYFFGGRGPDVLLEATSRLLEDRPEMADRLRLRFLGGLPAEAARRSARPPLSTVVEVLPTQPHEAVLQAQRDADVLVLFMQDGAGSEAVIPAKTWEYLASGRPILAIVPARGAAARLLLALGVGEVVEVGDLAGARVALDGIVARWEAGTLDVPTLSEEVLGGFSRRGRAEEMAAVIRGAIERSTTTV
jgi:glycosyltransferase involved in cell wall biosynthesis